ncbi:MAG: hypothetical protein OXM87_05665 [Truepera sp.]|nr:hypothetical protein [Truepera sp.]
MLTSMQLIANDIARRRTRQGFGHLPEGGLRWQAAARETRGGRSA